MPAPTRATPVDYHTLRPSRSDRSATVAPDALDVSIAFDNQFTVAAFAATVPSAVTAAANRRLHIVSLTMADAPHNIAVQPSNALAIAREVLNAAAALKAQLCVIPAPTVVARANANNQTPISYSDAINATYQLLTTLAEPAAAAGVTVAIRAPSGGCLLSPIEVRELVDSVYSPNVGVCIDVAALQQIGRLDDWTRILQHRIVCLRGPHTVLAPCADPLSDDHDSCTITIDAE